ncbi:hypothetical protein [Aphanothece minutissima]|uniref:Uncharacterized protein n=1 Tax=Aphanothece cf. minutissima CCALA 015 TaxID=2107695 RepID=A0ABX5F4H4_9CHRO|nr:hypothetical protein [Aphanothece minutissima]PSB36298.1 hypothetical protein C7B81_13620 [Aphanothece cf. minutissima CCALA 015]
MNPPEATDWQALSGPECLRRLGIDTEGLGGAAAAEHLDATGPNRLVLPPGPGRWRGPGATGAGSASPVTCWCRGT